jgi:glycosyltransferase involved in cell wall biosynthesis
MSERKSITLISNRIHERYLRLQPWRYLHEIGRQLTQQGYRVTIITDGVEDGLATQSEAPFTIRHIPDVNRYRWRSNSALHHALEKSKPDVILWHIGLPSFVHQDLDFGFDVPLVGIYPGLIYQPNEIGKLGVWNMVKELTMLQIHFLNVLIPRHFIRQAIQEGKLAHLVVLSETTRSKLIQIGVQPEAVKAIGPGVDDVWLDPPHQNGHVAKTREENGYLPEDKVILYYGSPQPLRGLHDLIRAVEIAHHSDPHLKLLILSRRREDELLKENAGLRNLLSRSRIRPAIKVVSGFLSPEKLVEYMAAIDAVALPFQLVPADGPLSLLEAQAQGKPVITTRVASLPELVEHGAHYLADPANPASLAEAVLAASKDINLERAQKRRGLPKLSPALRRWHQVGAEWSQLVQSL